MTPECPPTTVTGHSSGVAAPSTSDKNRAARTTSRVVTPNNFFGSNLPAFFKTSAAIGTVYNHKNTHKFTKFARVIKTKTDRVNGVGNDEDIRLGSVVCNSLSKITDDSSVGVKQIVASHSGLAGHAGGDDDNLNVLQRMGKLFRLVALDDRGRVDVRNIGSNAWRTTDIVQAERGHELVLLEQEREGLSDPT